MKGTFLAAKEKFPMTDVWMDSFTQADIQFGLEQGSVGVTTSPVGTAETLRDELEIWRPLIRRLIDENPNASEKEVFWLWNYEVAAKRCLTQLPFYEPGGTNGRFAIQANIYDYMKPDAIVAQAKKIRTIGPNTQIKIPTTLWGLTAMEEAVFEGVSVMATACLTVSQMLAAAEALDRGIRRREALGLSCEGISTVCAMQLKLQDDVYREYARAHGIAIDPECFHWAAIAVAKRAYQLYKQRGHRARMLTSYYDSVDQWAQFLGGDLIMTITIDWQRHIAFNAFALEHTIDHPVESGYVDELMKKLPMFAAAYEPAALSSEQFHQFPTVRRLIHWFANCYDEGVKIIRNEMLPWDCL